MKTERYDPLKHAFTLCSLLKERKMKNFLLSVSSGHCFYYTAGISHPSYLPAYEDETDRVFQHVNI